MLCAALILAFLILYLLHDEVKFRQRQEDSAKLYEREDDDV